MLKTKDITQMDRSLCNYVDSNCNEYKKPIKSAYMNKRDVEKFYSDMLEEKMQKQSNGKFNKRVKTRAKSIIDCQRKIVCWEKPTLVQMDVLKNARCGESNGLCLRRSHAPRISLDIGSAQENFKAEIEKLRKFREEKYIKKRNNKKNSCTFMANRKPSDSNLNAELRRATSPKNDHKIKKLVWQIFDKRTEADKQIGREAVKSEYRAKEEMFSKINTYFIKKNRYSPAL